MRAYRNNEHYTDFRTLFMTPVLTTSLRKIELEVVNIYMHEMFKEVKDEIVEFGALNVVERVENGDRLLFKMNKHSNPKKVVNVVYDKSLKNVACDCHLSESRGIPCSHIFVVIKNEHLDHIPSSLIFK